MEQSQHLDPALASNQDPPGLDLASIMSRLQRLLLKGSVRNNVVQKIK